MKKLWLKIKAGGRKLWSWIVVAVIGGVAVANVGGPPQNLTEAKVLTIIATYQDSVFATTNRYEQFDNKQELIDGGLDVSRLPFDVESTKYLHPAGAGYQVVFTRLVVSGQRETASGSGVFEDRFISETKSVGYGPEAPHRTYDWR